MDPILARDWEHTYREEVRRYIAFKHALLFLGTNILPLHERLPSEFQSTPLCTIEFDGEDLTEARHNELLNLLENKTDESGEVVRKHIVMC